MSADRKPHGNIYMTPAAECFHEVEHLLHPDQQSRLDLTLFVSLYNEEEYIASTLDTLRGTLVELDLTYEIIVIDDVSKDGSVEVVRRYIKDHPDDNILLRVNERNLGLAQNYLDAAFMGKGKYYRLICGDNSEPAESLKELFKHIGETDILIPNYVVNEGKSSYRMFLSHAYTKIINTISGNNIRYYNGLAVHLRYNVLRWHPNTRGFGFQADIICMLLAQGFTYKEIPMTGIDHEEKKSTALNARNILSVFHSIVDIFIRRLSNVLYKTPSSRS